MSDNKDLVKKESNAPLNIERTQTRTVFKPRVDIYEKGEDTILLADMPGVEEKNIHIKLEKNILSIYGSVSEEKHGNYRIDHSEYNTGDFERTFTLSNEIDREKIQATIKNGVLTLVLPKAEYAKPKKIEVKAI